MCIESFFFFNDTATTEIYTLSLHDALPISGRSGSAGGVGRNRGGNRPDGRSCPRSGRYPSPSARVGGGSRCTPRARRDRKSTRLNSSHANNSYAVFCLKKKKKQTHSKR